MKLKEIYSQDKQIISLEIFPPREKFDEKVKTLKSEISKLTKYQPALISVTHGAGGTYSGNSISLIKEIKENFDISIMPHFTCVNATVDSVNNFLKTLNELKIENILALRGDLPKDMPFTCNDFKHADELVSFIKSNTNMSVAVAGYPEKHPEAKTLDDDISKLVAKTDNGANYVFTQLFFENEIFKSYYQKVKEKREKLTVIPGILPIVSYSQITRMCELCGTKIPNSLMNSIEKFKDNSEDLKKLGTEYAIKQIKDLQKFGIKHFHLFTLNKSEIISSILDEIKEN